jgi:dipeptidase D
MGILSGLEPKEVFSYFEEICGIPHGSSNTKKISDYLVDFAKKNQLDYEQDVYNNVIIRKEGTKGYEQSPPVMLQGHMDMVCEKEADCDIDFEKEGLRLQVEDGVVSAKGTTLGGDDGIAVAYALAILAAKDIAHPPLEAVFTVDEEIGMLGAAALDCSRLQSRIMLNMDSEDEGHLLVSCAGGVTTEGHLPIEKTSVKGQQMTLTVTGLLGGHSGVEIHKGRANACQILGRTLYQLQKTCSFQLISVNGGLKDNAIPREATAKAVLTAGELAQWKDTVRQMAEIYKKEYALTDSEISLVTEELSTEESTNTFTAMTEETTSKVIAALVNLPGGIQKMSFAIPNLVQTSLNLGILKTLENEVSFSFAVRSNVGTEKQELVSRITCLMESLGGFVTCSGEYPAWEYRQDSPLRELMIQIFEKQYGYQPEVEALHAGVECGLFAGKLPGLDCVSFGPDMDDIHTPKESMKVDSVKRTWDYILEILRCLK